MITYDYYRIFYYVAQYKSFTRAAEALHNNQPNITRCMNNLESELNCTLFLRVLSEIRWVNIIRTVTVPSMMRSS